MKKYFFPISLFCAVTFFACSQNGEQKEVDKVSDTPKAIEKVEKTEYHVALPNSSFYIVPPMDFKVDALSGLMQKNNENGYTANFLSMQFIAGKTIPDYLAELKAESENKFPGVWTEEELTVSGHPAKLVQFQVMKGVVGYQLVFTDNITNEMLVAYYDANDEVTGGSMRRALKSAVVESKSK